MRFVAVICQLLKMVMGNVLGHATACAVAEANLDLIEEEGLVERVASLEPKLTAALAPLADHPQVVEVRSGIGLLAALPG